MRLLPEAPGAILVGLVLGGLLGLLASVLPGANDPTSVAYPVAGAVVGLLVGILSAAIPGWRRVRPWNPIRRRSYLALCGLLLGGAIVGFFASLALVFFVVLSCTAGAYTTTQGMALFCFALAAGVGSGLVWGFQWWSWPRIEDGVSPEAFDRGDRVEARFVGVVGVVATALGFGLFVALKPEPRPIAVFTLEDNRIQAVAFSPDGRTLAAASSESGVYLWDVVTRQRQVLQTPLPQTSRDVVALAFAKDARILAVFRGKELQLWDIPRAALKKSQQLPNGIDAIVASPAGLQWAVLEGDGSLVIGEVATGKETHRIPKVIPPQLELSGAFAFSPAGTLVAVGGRSKGEESFDEVYVLTVPRGELRTVLRGPGYMANPLAFSPDGSLLATTGTHGLVRVWETRTGELRHTFDGDVGAIGVLAFSPDGKLLAVGGGEHRNIFAPADQRGMVSLWDVATRKRLRTFKANRSIIASMAFSPDSKHLAVACGLRDVTLWEVAALTDSRP